MPRIQLAHWHAGQAPGSVLDVDDDQLRQLVRDGRVAALVKDDPTEPAPAAEPQDQAAEEPTATTPEPEAEEPAKSGGRRRR